MFPQASKNLFKNSKSTSKFLSSFSGLTMKRSSIQFPSENLSLSSSSPTPPTSTSSPSESSSSASSPTFRKTPRNSKNTRQLIDDFGAPINGRTNNNGFKAWEFVIPYADDEYHCTHCKFVFSAYLPLFRHFVEEHIRVTPRPAKLTKVQTIWGATCPALATDDQGRCPAMTANPPSNLKVAVTPNTAPMVFNNIMPDPRLTGMDLRCTRSCRKMIRPGTKEFAEEKTIRNLRFGSKY